MSEATTDKGRRDFIVVATNTMMAVGAAAVVYPLIDQMNPAADTLALASIEVNIAGITEGQAITVKWRGKPVFIRHRTADEIQTAAAANMDDLRDPQVDGDRVQKPELLVIEGICTHLGCVPLGQKIVKLRAITTAGSVHAMVRTMIHPGASARGLRQPISAFRHMNSSQTALSRSVKEIN
jgi:ubiquinol-cytochrome c reductase iron-sulfur subunit